MTELRTATEEVRARFDAVHETGEAALRATDRLARTGGNEGPEYIAMCRAAFEYGKALQAARQLAMALAEATETGRRWVA